VTNEIKAIETKYNGYRFRSRLEARWAVFFDALGEPWEYEREGFDLGEAGYYLPDFWLPRVTAWVEVKGQDVAPESDALRKIVAFAELSEYPLISLVGQIGLHRCVLDVHDLQRLGPVVEHIINPESPSYSKALERCPLCWSGKATSLRMDLVEGMGSNRLLLNVIGECRHRWFLRLRGEGNRIKVEQIIIPPKQQEDIDLGLLLAGSRELYEAAVTAARSARFEHGESGAGGQS